MEDTAFVLFLVPSKYYILCILLNYICVIGVTRLLDFPLACFLTFKHLLNRICSGAKLLTNKNPGLHFKKS